MATFDLGRVTPLYKGDYSASASYELNDVVLYEGNLYWHVQATATVGILPTDTTVWKLAFADKGVRAEIRGYADNAQVNADSALASESAAATSASNASASASQAALSAQSAQSAEAGATASAQTASTKASEASVSAQSAASSAQTTIDNATLASQKAAAASESASIANEAKTVAIGNAQLAVTKADEARNSATRAANSATSAQEYDESAQQSAVNAQTAQGLAEQAQTAAETAQGLAEDARDEAQQIKDDVEDAIAEKADSSEIGDLSQLETTAKDNLVSAINEENEAVAGVNERLSRLVPVAPIKTQFFENLNYGDPANVTFYSDRYPNNDGKIVGYNATSSLVVNVHPNTTYYMYVPGRNRQKVIESDGNFEIGETYTKLTVTTRTSYNGTFVMCFTTGATATNIMVYIYAGTYDYATNKNSIIMTENEFLPNIQPTIKRDFIPNQEIGQIRPKDTTFFSGINYFSPNDAIYYTDRFINNSTYTINAYTTAKTLVFQVRPSTTYYLYIPNPNRGVIVESENNDFYIGTTHTPLYTSGPLNVFTFTTGANANYVAVYFATGDYDYEANKDSIVLNIGEYIGNASPHIAKEYLPDSFRDNLAGTKVLIFGDSITDTCNFTINAADQTTAVTWKNPSNSYVDAGGNTITFNMWPKILKDMGVCAEIRNYARSGASYQDAQRTSGEERQNLSYQITVALNDLDNPNDVFIVDDFVPDIVIFALGTNDGEPDDTYADAMAKTVLKSDGYSIDTTATLANLDMSKFCESARSAFLRTRVAFPYAQFFCVLPIQRANNETNGEDLNADLRHMARRYGCIVIDGFSESGIIRDTNVWNTIGDTLKDGLHPNDKGQDMMFRMIYTALKTHYIHVDQMNN